MADEKQQDHDEQKILPEVKTDKPTAIQKTHKEKSFYKNKWHALLCLLPPMLVLIASVLMTKSSLEFPKADNANTNNPQQPYTAYADEDSIIKTFANLRRTRNRNEVKAQLGINASTNSNESESVAVDRTVKYINSYRRLVNRRRDQINPPPASASDSNSSKTLNNLNRNAFSYADETALLDKERDLSESEETLIKSRELDPFQVNAGRMIWGSISIVYVCICAATLGVGLYIIHRMFKDDPKPRVRKKALKIWKTYERQLTAIIVILCIAAFVKLFHFPINNYLTLPGLIESTIGQDWYSIAEYKHLSEYLTVFMGLFLTVICGVLIWDYDQNRAKLTERMSLLRTVLYLAAALLVMKILQSSALLSWSMIYLNPGDKKESIDYITKSMLTQESIGYTVFLAALYIPALFLIRSWAIEEATEANIAAATPVDIESDLKSRGFVFSVWEYLPKVVAVFSPVLAPPIAALLSNLSK